MVLMKRWTGKFFLALEALVEMQNSAVTEERLNKAVAQIDSLLSARTDCLRLINGAGDGVPGFWLESYAGNWLAITDRSEMPAGVLDWLKENGKAKSIYWKRLDQHEKGPPVHLFGKPIEGPFVASENGLRFEISFQSGYSQGIFLDQRDNRAEVSERMEGGGKLLNLFAYTGAFSVAGAAGGGETTTLDLSTSYLNWARRNFGLNGLDTAEHHFCRGDAFHWLRRFAKQGRKFDGVVLDPPTFSRDARGQVFRVERDFGELAALARGVLEKGGWMLCCTNFRGMSEESFIKIIGAGTMRAVGMPKDFYGDPYLKTVWVD